MKRITNLFLTLIMLIVFFVPVQAYATEMENTQTEVDLTVEDMTTNAYAYIEQALQYAKETATDEQPVTVTLPSGTYDLSGCLHIYSNTVLILQPDTVLIKTANHRDSLGKCNRHIIQMRNTAAKDHKNRQTNCTQNYRPFTAKCMNNKQIQQDRDRHHEACATYQTMKHILQQFHERAFTFKQND